MPTVKITQRLIINIQINRVSLTSAEKDLLHVGVWKTYLELSSFLSEQNYKVPVLQ